MHDDEVPIDAGLVTRLLRGQFPDWADLPIERVRSDGTDNALFRLGTDLVARLPRIHWASGQVEKEHRWLPWLAPRLPLAIPEPVALGRPAEGYPWCWGVYGWLPGEMLSLGQHGEQHGEQPVGLIEVAGALSRFVRALHGIEAAAGPRAGAHNSGRGVPLRERDALTRQSIALVRDEYDRDGLMEVWEAALAVPTWDGPDVWIHGDLSASNLLMGDEGLTGVIDFGCLGVGDPACDAIIGWEVFSGQSRAVFREGAGFGEATWDRGRGWALSTALVALPYYRDRHEMIAARSRRVIDAVLADYRAGGG
ncbi:MAG: aminoglycoside phosphotransferase family protein [Chloroflexota bacterium]